MPSINRKINDSLENVESKRTVSFSVEDQVALEGLLELNHEEFTQIHNNWMQFQLAQKIRLLDFMKSNNQDGFSYELHRNGGVCSQNDLNEILLIAAKKHSIAFIRKLISHGANVNSQDDTGKTPLHLAVQRNGVAIVKLLLAQGAKVDAVDNLLQTPLHLSSGLSTRHSIFKTLLDCGANVNLINKNLESPLFIAAKKGAEDKLELLLNKGAIPKVLQLHSPLTFAAEHKMNFSLIKRLLQFPELRRDGNANLALKSFVLYNQQNHINEFFKYPEIILNIARNGNFVFRTAVQFHRNSLAKRLLNLPLVKQRLDSQSNGALFSAVMASNHEMQDILLSYTAVANNVSVLENRILKEAVRISDVPAFNRVYACVTTSFTWSEANKLLMQAATVGHVEMMTRLLEINDLQRHIVANHRIIIRAFENGHMPLVNLLQRHGAQLPEYLQNVEPAQTVNTAQSVHELSVHQGVAKAAIELKEHYLKNKSPNILERALSLFSQFVSSAQVPANEVITNKPAAAQRALGWLMGLSFTEYRSQLTMQEALGVVWLGHNDESLRIHEEKTEKSNNETDEHLAGLLQTLYEIQRGYNLNERNIDDGMADRKICIPGAFNKLIYSLNGHHQLVNIPFVTKETITAKSYSLIDELFEGLDDNVKQDCLEHWSGSFPEPIIAIMEPLLRSRLRDEFAVFESASLNIDAIIDEIVGAMEYVTPKAVKKNQRIQA